MLANCDVPPPRAHGRAANTLPRITVVTPSYNQGKFLERAILSVLSQQYPNLEYIICDAGSTDNSVSIIKKHQKRLTYWVSERDRGQSDAINKGWGMASGDILAWLNSDDFYYPGALHEMARLFAETPDLKMVCGSVAQVDESGRELRVKRPGRIAAEVLLPWEDIPPQVGTFIARDVFDRLGGPRLDLHYVMDWELWLRVALNYPCNALASSDKVVGADRQWHGTKTLNAAGRDAAESRMVMEQLFEKKQLAPNLLSLKRAALARSWWRQSKGELKKGLRRCAFASLSNAICISPRTFSPVKILRQFKRILFHPGVKGKVADKCEHKHAASSS